MNDLDLEQLKPITEHFLQDVKASDELKERTLARIARESGASKPRWPRILARGSAAALLLIGGLFIFDSMLNELRNGPTDPGTIEIAPGHANGLPGHVPKRFVLLEQVPAPERNGEWGTLRYTAPNGLLVLTRSAEAWPVEEGFSAIAIVPTSGVVNDASPGSVKQLPDGTLELRWQSKTDHYRLTGTVSLQEALAVAGSMTGMK